MFISGDIFVFKFVFISIKNIEIYVLTILSNFNPVNITIKTQVNYAFINMFFIDFIN